MTTLALDEFTLPASLEAHDPPEARGLARDGVRMLVSRRASGEISHHGFGELPGLLLPGDLLVVNTSATLPAQVRVSAELAVHFSGPRPDGSWLTELRLVRGKTTVPNDRGTPGQRLRLPGGAVLTLEERATPRLWRARLSVAVVPYLLRYGSPIRYSYVPREWPLSYYQTVFAREPGSAEMPSASRPFTPSVVTRLVAGGVLIAPLTLHCGVSSLEGDEDPYPEPFDVPPATADLVNHVRARGGRVIAGGTTVVRALETAALGRADDSTGRVRAAAGWTSHVVTPETGVRAVDGLLTGLHEPRSSHLRMLAAFAGPDLLARCYQAAIDAGYLWHEFGDVHLLLP
jgi:S-adenosylmethionine:tRNA ribosyltransferase-isomerase